MVKPMKITDSQKAKMDSLGIPWLESMTREEARDAIVDFLGLDDCIIIKKKAYDLSQNALVIPSEFDD